MKYFVFFVILFTGFSIIATENTFAEKCLPIELEYSIDGGNVTELCKSDTNVQVNVKIQASENGYLNIEIPTKVVYSLDGLNCELGNLFVLMDGYEIIPDNTISDNTKNIITVSFHEEGNHTITFVGSSIIPDPGPSDYCGIVMGFDSLYLPPRFQEKNEVTLKHIHCNENLKVLERFDGSAACVDYDTRTKLIERGWGKNSLYELDDKIIIENVQDLKEVKAFLAKYPNANYGVERDSWLVYYSVQGVIPDEPYITQSRHKEIQIEIDPFGRPLWVGIECGGPVSLSAQPNVIELLNTPNWCFPDGNEIKSELELKTPKDIAINNIKKVVLEPASSEKIMQTIQNEVDEKNLGQFSALVLRNLKEEFEDGEKITFDLVAFGYRDWCIIPQISLYYKEYEEHIYKMPALIRCPPPTENPGPRVFLYHQYDFGLFPKCKFPGIHTIKGESFEYGPEVIGSYYCHGTKEFHEPKILDIIIPKGALSEKKNFEPQEMNASWGDYVQFTNNESVSVFVIGESDQTKNNDSVQFGFTVKPGESWKEKILYEGNHWFSVRYENDTMIPWFNATIIVD
jgi:hypothetical protein